MTLGSQTVILITFSNGDFVRLSSTHACCGECRALPGTFAAMQNRPPGEAEIASGWPLARSGRSAGFPELARVVTSFFRGRHTRTAVRSDERMHMPHAVLGRPEFGLDASAGWSGGAGGLSSPLAVAGVCVTACVCRANDS